MDTWAFSTRIFPTDADAIAAEAFGAANAEIKGWVLDSKKEANGIGVIQLSTLNFQLFTTFRDAVLLLFLKRVCIY